MDNPIKMDDLGVPPLFLETPIYIYIPTEPNQPPLKLPPNQPNQPNC